MSRLLADAGDVGQRSTEGSLGTFVAVVGNGEAVDFVLYLFQQVEEWIGGLKLDDFDLGSDRE